MGKPGQRHTHNPIIDKPELKTPARKMLEGSITAILWIAWAYWIIPVATVILWTVGIRMFYQALFSADQFKELRLILENGGLALLAIFVFNLLWINYNYYFIYRKFGTRRKSSRRCEDREFASFYQIEEKELLAAKEHNRFEITLRDGKITIDSAATVEKT